MSKIFLYIDESKEYKNNTLYIGGLVSRLWFHAFEKICSELTPSDFHYELKWTRKPDRELFLNMKTDIDKYAEIQVWEYLAYGDRDYLDCLWMLLADIMKTRGTFVSEIHIFADFIRLDSDMRKLEKSLSKKFSNQFWIPIVLEFKNSSQYRSIQFADLAVGIHRRE